MENRIKSWNAHKKALAISQVFTFLVMLITFAIIMLFGYKAIAGFLKSGEEVQFVQFSKDLESSLRRIASDYGSVRVESFSLPPGYLRICFVDLNYPATPGERGELCALDAIACDAWEAAVAAQHTGDPLSGYRGSEENVFLTPSSPSRIKVVPFTITPLPDNAGNAVLRGYLCLPLHQGSFSLQLEGKGDHTEVSEVVSEN